MDSLTADQAMTLAHVRMVPVDQVSGHGPTNVWAFSLRPDLWAPGVVACAWAEGGSWVAGWNSTEAQSRRELDYGGLRGLDQPGRMEALVLRGLVTVDDWSPGYAGLVEPSNG